MDEKDIEAVAADKLVNAVAQAIDEVRLEFGTHIGARKLAKAAISAYRASREAQGWVEVPAVPTDERLRPFGYAPGSYMSRCFLCEDTSGDMDKRATCCRPCAVRMYERYVLAATNGEAK